MLSLSSLVSSLEAFVSLFNIIEDTFKKNTEREVVYYNKVNNFSFWYFSSKIRNMVKMENIPKNAAETAAYLGIWPHFWGYF